MSSRRARPKMARGDRGLRLRGSRGLMAAAAAAASKLQSCGRYVPGPSPGSASVVGAASRARAPAMMGPGGGAPPVRPRRELDPARRAAGSAAASMAGSPAWPRGPREETAHVKGRTVGVRGAVGVVCAGARRGGAEHVCAHRTRADGPAMGRRQERGGAPMQTGIEVYMYNYYDS
jgi:hypothetical protein